MKRIQYRQGDVLIEPISGAVKGQPQQAACEIILAHGEVTGHHHKLVTKDPADWWKEGDISSGNDKPGSLAGSITVALPDGGCVTHQEHATIELPPGQYRVSRQREYSPSEVRNVAD